MGTFEPKFRIRIRLWAHLDQIWPLFLSCFFSKIEGKVLAKSELKVQINIMAMARASFTNFYGS